MHTTTLGISIRAVAAFMAMALLPGCGADATDAGAGGGSEGSGTRTAPGDAARPRPGNGPEWFTDRAADAGLDFVHFNGMSGEFYFPEIMPPGVGLLDVDNDGDLDVYLVQGQLLGTGTTIGQALLPPPGPLPLTGRLYRNDLTVQRDATRTLRFTDVTDESRIDAREYGMGVAAGDVDNDGRVDLYLTNLGPNQLFRNNGDGTFSDVSRQSGLDDSGWSVSAAFVDYDRDGWLDLYVGNYVDYSTDADRECPSETGRVGYCVPQVYRAQPDRLYRNEGDGTFVDVTATALGTTTFGPALGVATADFDGDGWLDIFVANDGEANQLWMNRRDGTFGDAGLLSGTALNGAGDAEGSMGVDAGDFDNDGDEDLFMTHLTTETNTLYVNDGTGLFEDRSALSGLGPPSLMSTGFGTAWLDFDNDGWLDVLTVNGRVSRTEERANEPFPYDQPKQLFRNLGDGRFEEVTDRAGAVFAVSEVGRRRRLRRRGQRRRHRRARRQRQRKGPPARQPGGQPPPLAGIAAGGQRGGPARHARRACRSRAERRNHVVAPGARGRQLRVGQRPPGARRAGRYDGRSPRSRALAERAGRGVDRRGNRSMDGR